MVSKLAQSGIALLLARGVLGATDGGSALQALDGLLKDLGEEPSAKRQQGAVPAIPDERDPSTLSEVLTIKKNCTAVVCENEVQLDILDFVARAITDGEVQFYKDLKPDEKREILLIGWSGICFAVDGRCDKINLRKCNPCNLTKTDLQDIVKSKCLPCVADRKLKADEDRDLEHTFRKAISFPANKITETPEFRNILRDVRKHREDRDPARSAYVAIEKNPESIFNFWNNIGEAHFASVSAFGEDKPTWVYNHPGMKYRHYQVDIGSGKAEAFKLVENGELAIKRFGKTAGHVTYDDVISDDILKDHRIKKLTAEPLSKLLKEGKTKAVQDMLNTIVDAMVEQFKANEDDLCNEEDSPTLAFGATGQWREAQNRTVSEMLEATIKIKFDGLCTDVNFFICKHEDEAKYGALSWLQIPNFLKVIKEHNEGQFRYLVSIEAGSGSTQVGVINLETQQLMPATLKSKYPVTAQCDRLIASLQDF